ncbi:CPBP family intramembrane metalloprotease, partial [Myxococcota bacterium]|nr:CPBP family intramembrane metalloprotease [Myxococcota bacterium]
WLCGAGGVTLLLAGTPTAPMGAALQSALGWGLLALGGAGLQERPVRVALAISAPARSQPWGLTALWAGGLASLSFGLNALASAALRSPVGVRPEIQQTVSELPTSELLQAFAAFAVGPAVSEELLFRGLIIGVLARSPLKPQGVIVFSAMVFGLAHIDPVQASISVVLGLYLGALTWAAGSVRPAILAHALNNGLVLVVIRLEAKNGGGSCPGLIGFLGALCLGGALWSLSSRIREAGSDSVPSDG